MRITRRVFAWEAKDWLSRGYGDAGTGRFPSVGWATARLIQLSQFGLTWSRLNSLFRRPMMHAVYPALFLPTLTRPSTRETSTPGRHSMREGKTFVKGTNERFIKTRLYDNSRFFLRFGQSFFFAISITKGCCTYHIYHELPSVFTIIQPCICELAVYMTERIDFDDCLPGWGKGASS